MSYRCQACGQACSGQMIRHVEYREVGYPANVGTPDRPKFVQKFKRQIAREIPVCAGCMAGLRSGITIDQLRRLQSEQRDVVECSTPDKKGSDAKSEWVYKASPPSPAKQEAQLPDLFG